MAARAFGLLRGSETVFAQIAKLRNQYGHSANDGHRSTQRISIDSAKENSNRVMRRQISMDEMDASRRWTVPAANVVNFPHVTVDIATSGGTRRTRTALTFDEEWHDPQVGLQSPRGVVNAGRPRGRGSANDESGGHGSGKHTDVAGITKGFKAFHIQIPLH
jgi:hypothetical protein